MPHSTKLENFSQQKGRIGELEFELFLTKVHLAIKGGSLFGQETRNAYIRPIKFHHEDDFGIDYSTEIFWETEAGGEPSGLTIFFQVKNRDANPKFEQKDFDYFRRQAAFRPVVIVWKNNNTFKFILYNKWINQTPLTMRLQTMQNQKFSFPKNDWDQKDVDQASSWMSLFIQQWYDSLTIGQLNPLKATVSGAKGILVGILSGHGYYFKEGKDIELYKKGEFRLLLGTASVPSNSVLIPDPTKGGKSVFINMDGFNRHQILGLSIKKLSSKETIRNDKIILLSFDRVSSEEEELQKKHNYFNIFNIHIDDLTFRLPSIVKQIDTFVDS